MSNIKKTIFVFAIVVFIFCLIIFGKSNPESLYLSSEINNQEDKSIEGDKEIIFFTGDIMLDRGAEYYSNKENNIYYPFEKISFLFEESDLVVGNLEGPIVKNPPYFSDESLKFAFSSEMVKALSRANFNLLSLANNHTLNMGRTGLEETKELLREGNIGFSGDPVSCDKDFSFQKNNIIFLVFNKSFPFNCSNQEIEKIIKEIRSENLDKFLILIFHWGQEYQEKSSIYQKELAYLSVNAGADLIIGSHPHVVQEIEEYRGKMIFYSLGNFIFDQFFSEETERGLVVKLELYLDKLVYSLLPVQIFKAQPFLMVSPDLEEFLEELSLKSPANLSEQIKVGVITIKIR